MTDDFVIQQARSAADDLWQGFVLGRNLTQWTEKQAFIECVSTGILVAYERVGKTAAELEQARKFAIAWVPVDESLPDGEGGWHECLVSMDCGGVTIGWYCVPDNEWNLDPDRVWGRVTHWAELPSNARDLPLPTKDSPECRNTWHEGDDFDTENCPWCDKDGPRALPDKDRSDNDA